MPPVSIQHVIISIWIAIAVILSVKHIRKCYKAYHLVSYLANERDEKSEIILSSSVGAKKDVRVFRTCLAEPVAVAFKPHIYLPGGVDFTDDELRVILRHEWKHLHNKDHLVNLIMEFVSFIFWWNPLVALLKKNITYSQELTCDYFAFAENPEEDRYNLVSAIMRLGNEEKNVAVVGSNLVGSKDEFADRVKTWDLYGDKKSHNKRIVANICFFVISAMLFVVSYMFVILPSTTESDLMHVDNVDGVIAPVECYYSEEAYRAEENFIYDNGDGTFSLYIDGMYVTTVDSIDENSYIPVRIRDGGSP
jgi:beta-lactamase regulating signal transducer with metallopeptidase domain